MGLTSYYGGIEKDDDVNRETIKLAIELGCTFIDTSDAYGPPMGANERLIGSVIKDPELRAKVFICTKFGVGSKDGKPMICGQPAYVRERCEESLKNLQVDYIDLYYQHRVSSFSFEVSHNVLNCQVDRTIPIEETWKEMAALQAEGKVKYLGISEATAEEIRRANSIAKVSALQIEFSPWTTDIRDNGILDTCRELGISIVAYSPLGRGFLTGAIKSIDDLEPSDHRRGMPRMQEAFQENLKIVDALKAVADRKGITPSQLCLAWVFAQGEDFIAIPGTKKPKYLRENAAARDIVLSPEELEEVNEITRKIKAVGARFNDAYRAFAGF